MMAEVDLLDFLFDGRVSQSSLRSRWRATITERLFALHETIAFRSKSRLPSLDAILSLPLESREAVLDSPFLTLAYEKLLKAARLPSPNLLESIDDLLSKVLIGLTLNGPASFSIPFVLTVRAASNGQVELPSGGKLVWKKGQLVPRRLHITVGDDGNGLERVADDSGQDISSPTYLPPKQKVLRSIDNWGVTLNVTKGYRHVGRLALERSPLNPGRKAEARFRIDDAGIEVFDSALEGIQKALPGWFTRITENMSTIVPFQCPRVVGLTLRFFRGAGFITPELPIYETADHLVHECAHQMLNTVMDLADLLVKQEGEVMMDVPWRDDPRPLAGALHGIYAFGTAAQLLSRWEASGSEGAALEEQWTSHADGALKVAQAAQSSPALTEFGREFLDRAIESNRQMIRPSSSRTPGIQGKSISVAGRS
jgi:HEXXH motif-containing protein